jgi:hypothetical protein
MDSLRNNLAFLSGNTYGILSPRIKANAHVVQIRPMVGKDQYSALITDGRGLQTSSVKKLFEDEFPLEGGVCVYSVPTELSDSVEKVKTLSSIRLTGFPKKGLASLLK